MTTVIPRHIIGVAQDVSIPSDIHLQLKRCVDKIELRIKQYDEALENHPNDNEKVKRALRNLHSSRLQYMWESCDLLTTRARRVPITICMLKYVKEQAMSLIHESDGIRTVMLMKIEDFKKLSDFPELVKEASELEAAILRR